MGRKNTTIAQPNVASDNDFMAEDDHRTMSRAEEIKGDTKRMKAVSKFHRKRQGEMSKLGKVLGGRR